MYLFVFALFLTMFEPRKGIKISLKSKRKKELPGSCLLVSGGALTCNRRSTANSKIIFETLHTTYYLVYFRTKLRNTQSVF